MGGTGREKPGYQLTDLTQATIMKRKYEKFKDRNHKITSHVTNRV